jgi:hypothetical protein
MQSKYHLQSLTLNMPSECEQLLSGIPRRPLGREPAVAILDRHDLVSALLRDFDRFAVLLRYLVPRLQHHRLLALGGVRTPRVSIRSCQ